MVDRGPSRSWHPAGSLNGWNDVQLAFKWRNQLKHFGNQRYRRYVGFELLLWDSNIT